jgi:alpha-glucosidase
MSKNPLASALKKQRYEIKSPDENITVQIVSNDKLQWSVQHKGEQIIKPSSVSLQLENGEVLGDHATVKSSETRKVDTMMRSHTGFLHRKKRKLL